MQSVLVTGGAGYIGSHVCKALALRGWLPVTVDDLSTGHRAAVKFGPLIEGDIADPETTRRAVQEFGVTGALHFAAKSLVGDSNHDPLGYYESNVSRGIAFLQHLRSYGVDQVLMSSTAAVYGIPSFSGPISETTATIPVNPYGATKLALEDALKWSAGLTGGRYAILRYFNAAGADSDNEIGEKHDPETHLIPLVIDATLGLRPPVKVFGDDYDTPDGTAVRDYIHVEDLASAHVLTYAAMDAGNRAQLYNAGAGHGHSVRDVLEAAKAVLGRPVPHTLAPRRPGDPPALVADISRLCAQGWVPSRSDLTNILSTASKWHAASRRFDARTPRSAQLYCHA